MQPLIACVAIKEPGLPSGRRTAPFHGSASGRTWSQCRSRSFFRQHDWGTH